MSEENSQTWVICDSTSDDPIEFVGTEQEMQNAVTTLFMRFLKAGYDIVLTIWTGYAWRKQGLPYGEFSSRGMTKFYFGRFTA